MHSGMCRITSLLSLLVSVGKWIEADELATCILIAAEVFCITQMRKVYAPREFTNELTSKSLSKRVTAKCMKIQVTIHHMCYNFSKSTMLNLNHRFNQNLTVDRCIAINT
jgi:hypothetical protein